MSRRYSVETCEIGQVRAVAVVETSIHHFKRVVWGRRALAVVVLHFNRERRIFRADGRALEPDELTRTHPDAADALRAAGEL